MTVKPITSVEGLSHPDDLLRALRGDQVASVTYSQPNWVLSQEQADRVALAITIGWDKTTGRLPLVAQCDWMSRVGLGFVFALADTGVLERAGLAPDTVMVVATPLAEPSDPFVQSTKITLARTIVQALGGFAKPPAANAAQVVEIAARGSMESLFRQARMADDILAQQSAARARGFPGDATVPSSARHP